MIKNKQVYIITQFIIMYLSFLMRQYQSSYTMQKYFQLSQKQKYFCQIMIILIFANFYTMVKCQIANAYNQNFNQSAIQPRFQAVSNDGLYFVTSQRKITIDSFRVFKTKTEEQGFSQVSHVLLNNARISDIKISNQGQKIVYLDANSYKAKVHWKRTDGSFQSQADQQIYVANGPNSLDISSDGNILVIVGNDTFANIYKSNGKLSQFSLFQTIDVLNEVVGENITINSNFYTCSISKDLKSLVFSGQTGEIYLYQLAGVTYKFFQKIPSQSGNSSHSITYALKLSSDSTIMIAGTNKNFLSFYRSAKGKNFSAPTIYSNCFLYANSAYRVAVTENGDTFYASCYYPSPTHIFKRQKNSSSLYTLVQTIQTIIDAYSLSVSGQGAYLLVGDKQASSFKIFQYFCGNGDYFGFDGVCQPCNNTKCNKCSRFSPNKCFQCNQGYMINNSCQTCSQYGGSCLACNTSSCICDFLNGETYELECKKCINFICKQCFSTCKTCSGSGPSECLSCKDNYTLETNNSCLPQCFSTCKTCSGSSPSQCLSCKDNYTLQANNSCLLQCFSTCKTCNGSGPSQCLSCKDNYTLQANNSCLPQCFSTCKTCSGPNSSQCLSCKDNYTLQANNSCLLQCFSTCKTCSGSGPSQCLSCKNNYTLQANNSCVQSSTIINRNNSTNSSSQGEVDQNSSSTNTQEEASLGMNIAFIIFGVIIIVTSIITAIGCLIRKYIHNSHPAGIQRQGGLDASRGLVNLGIENKYGVEQIEARQCSICLMKEVTHSTNCNHYFHFDCINAWILMKSKCPNCRRQVNKIDIREIRKIR